MTDGFQVTVTDETITVVTEAFTLVFDKDKVGLTSFRYETGGTWHEGVGTGTVPPLLFGPYFWVKDLGTGFLYPDGGTSLLLVKNLGWFLEIDQIGWLRNSLIPDCTDFPVWVWWRLWPSGRLVCKIKMSNNSGRPILILEESWRLNPADDQDINPGRDDPPDLNWFGFYSDNSGGGEHDLSHDAIAVPMQKIFYEYDVTGKINRVYHVDYPWSIGGEIGYEWGLALSANGSWGDIVDSSGFQARGDALSRDYRNPDPLDGSVNAGEILVGTPVSSGYSYQLGAYTIRAI